jgi:hypothetical protein
MKKIQIRDKHPKSATLMDRYRMVPVLPYWFIVFGIAIKRLNFYTKQEVSSNDLLKAVSRIHDILMWIRIRGSMPLTNRSESGFGSDAGLDPTIFVIDSQDINEKRNKIKKVFLLITF